MRATFQNTGMVLSIGLFFSLMIVGLSALAADHDACRPRAQRRAAAQRPRRSPTSPRSASLFAAFLGYNPMETLVPQRCPQLPPDKAANITGKKFFPQLISEPFIDGLRIAFTASMIMCLIAAWASWLRGGQLRGRRRTKSVRSAQPEDVAAGAADETPLPEEWVPA